MNGLTRAPGRQGRSWRLRLASMTTSVAVVAALLTGVMLASVPVSAIAAAGDPCAVGGNKIACENSKPGTDPSVWDIDGAGDESIQGFATDISVNVGSRIDFKIDTDASNYSITIYRIGYYGGDGARQVATVSPSATLPQRQPQCISDATTELYDCGNWAVSASWNVPSTAVSGVYVAKLHRSDRNDSSHITFIVRDDSSHSDVVFQTSDPTWQAYNTYGGSDFYQGADNGRAYKISYNRPVMTRNGVGGRDFFFSNEYPLVRFLEQNGYDVSYIAGVDTDRAGALLKNHKVFLSVGHDEYWSKAQRANVEAARDAGVNLQFLSGNEVYWKTRYESSADSSHTPYRTLVSYKETWSNAKIDPSDEWTGTWRDPRYAPRSKGGGMTENGLTGTAYMVNYSDLALKVPAEQGKLRLWRNTSVANLAAGTTATLAPHTVGYESDEDLDNGERPAGLIRLSTTTGDVPEYLLDFGNNVAPGSTTHHLTMYRAPSGALVFGAGTVQWTWGLDGEHDSPFAPEPADARMRQAQVNLLADMGAQPFTLASGLTAATKSTDTAGPTVVISSPAAGASQQNGSRITVTGTAADTGGRVAGVEASTDGGSTWHPATGTTAWSYTFIQHGNGTSPLRVRAIDDSGNIGAPTDRSFNVACPCSVFGATVPAVPASDDASSAELGLRFTPTSSGFVSGVRFYKGSGNTGTHVGSLWSSSAELLASATFSNESATGWQSVTFGTPVPVTAGQTYVVSYTVPNGHYAVQPWAFSSSPTDAGPLMVDGGFGATPAGVYGNAGQFPSQSYQNANYFVDVSFTSTDESPLIATNQWPLAGSSSVALDTTVSARLSKPVVASSVGIVVKDANGVAVAGSTAYDATTRTVTFTPSQPLAGFVKFTSTVSATDTLGNQVSTGRTWSFTTARPPNAPGVCPCSLFDDSTVPTLLEDVDKAAVTLGVKVSPDVNGTITGVRFYKGLNNTGTHTGTLWSSTGQVLAQGTFTDESTTGWQTLTFAQPVPVTKGSTYVASYRTTVGRYSATPNAFANANLSRPPLSVTSSAGAYTYGTGFPDASSSTSYLVDVVFEKVAPTLAVTAQDPAPGATSVARGTPIRVWFSSAITSGATMTVKSGSTTIAGTTSLGSGGTQLTFTPGALLPASSTITVTLAGVTSTEGVTLPQQTWSFETRGADAANSQSLFSDLLPEVAAADEGSPVELGTVVTPSKDGKITAIRFFKGTGNNGTHTGSVWSMSGDRLATVTFVGESPSGWQTANLTQPLSVTAGTSYVVSYLAPQGHYSYTSGFFNNPWTSGDLTSPSGNNGRYLYGDGGGFPTFSWGSSNYFVDVVFEAAPATIAVASRTPVAGAVDVARTVTPSITLSAPVAPGWSMSVKQGTTTIAGTASLSADQTKLTFTPTSNLPAGADITVTVSGVVSTDGAVLATQTWTFRTEASAPSTYTSLFTGLTPSKTSINDKDAVELGTAFTPSVDGTVTAIKFFKGSGNTGTHTGSIWSATGTRLATVTFTNESSSGWQTAQLSTPLALTAGQTYVVSYFAPNGHYSGTPRFFYDNLTSGPLFAPGGNNGRFTYGASGGFPTSSFNATNYFVDVVFRSSAP